MSKKKFNSVVLRRLAGDILQRIIEDAAVPVTDEADLVTSLVRQWITYDGNAIVFLGEHQFYLKLAKSPLGEYCVDVEPIPLGSWDELIRQWKIGADDLPDVWAQLNRGQSAEVTNVNGAPVRFWVNPGERKKGIEPLVKRPLPPDWKRDYHTIARNIVEKHLGPALEENEKEELSSSVAGQWQKYAGYACLFFEAKQLHLTLTELEEGNCTVDGNLVPARIEPFLQSLGIPAEAIPAALSRINLDQVVEFQGGNGDRSCLWYDRHARQPRVQALEADMPLARSSSPPIMCPRCSAVLKLWQPGQQQQACPHCGQTISLA